MNATRVRVDTEANAELLQTTVTKRQDLLSDQLGELLVVLVIGHLREVRRDVTDEDGVWFLATVFKLPTIERKGP